MNKYYVFYVSYGERLFSEGYDKDSLIRDLQYSGYNGWSIDTFDSKEDVVYRKYSW